MSQLQVLLKNRSALCAWWKLGRCLETPEKEDTWALEWSYNQLDDKELKPFSCYVELFKNVNKVEETDGPRQRSL